MIGKIALLAVLGLAAVSVSATRYSPELLSQFKDWQFKHKKVYGSVEAFEHAMENFKASLVRVAQKNAASDGANWAGLTKFSDLSPAEFKKIYLRATHNADTARRMREVIRDVLPITNVAAPTSVDWRTHTPQVVSAVKDQGQCGSCWAFATTESIESMWALAGNDLVELSPEQIVDCDTVDQGCNGGLPSNAYQYVMKAGGIDTEASYPYTAGGGQTGSCQFNPANIGARVANWTALPTNEDQLAAWLVTNGPISIGINAGWMQTYSHGVANPLFCPASGIDHGVLIVGFGTQKGVFGTEEFWIIKNSWSASWGEEGYCRIVKGKAKCGLNTMCTSAIVNKA